MLFHSDRRTVTHIALLMLCVAPGAGLVSAQDIKDAVEPPIVGRYEGSLIKEQSVRAFDRTAMATQFNARRQFERIDVEGRRTLTALQGPRGRSALEIFTNYTNALKSAGFRVLYTCSRANCASRMLEGLVELRRQLSLIRRRVH